MHQRREVAVAGADHERRDVVAFERQLDGVDGHLDVGGVLAGAAHPLRDLDQLDLMAGEQPPVVVERRPVGVGPPDHHPPALGEGVGDGPEVERRHAEPLARADGEVLVVEEQGDPFVVGYHRQMVARMRTRRRPARGMRAGRRCRVT